MIFVDTSAWVALADPDDEHHAAATRVNAEVRKGAHGKLVTTDYVLNETLSLVRDRVGFDHLRAFAQGLLGSPNVHLLWVEEAQFRTSLDLMLTREDKRWSFTDCTSFVTMKSMGVREAFAFDSDFRQAGFVVIP